MKLFMHSRNTCILILILFIHINQIYAMDSNSIPKLLWQKEFSGGEGVSCTPHDIRFGGTNNTLFISGMSFHPKDYTDGKFLLFEIDPNGNEIRRYVLKETNESRSSSIRNGWRAKGLKVTNDGKIYAVAEFEGATTSFLKTNREGTNTSIVSLQDTIHKKNGNAIWRMTNLSDGGFLFIGRDGDDKALIMKLDAEGSMLWEKIYEAGKLSFFSDCVPFGNKGDFVAVGLSSEYAGEESLTKLSTIRIVKCNANGEKISEINFPGGSPSGQKFPQICQLISGNLVVAYDKGVTMMNTDYHIKVFSSDLKPLWEKAIAKSENGQSVFFNIRAVPGDGFIAAHCMNLRDIRVYKYDEHGNEIKKFLMNQINGFGDFGIECTEDKVFIVFPTIPEDSEYISKIHVIALNFE